MKMTQQEIEAFALQYHCISCVKMHGHNKLLKPLDYFSEKIPFVITKIEYIELRSIDSLTDEESSYLGDILQTLTPENFIDHIKNGHSYLKNAAISIEAFDYLRSIGIAVPFRGYSVEEMIKQGILKLKK